MHCFSAQSFSEQSYTTNTNTSRMQPNPNHYSKT